MTVYYHVTDKWDGGDLESLAEQLGEADACAEFARRWPEAESLAIYHVHYVHLFDSLDRANLYPPEHGIEILRVDTSGLDVQFDDLEPTEPHYVVFGRIPSAHISRV